jgi:hypothetical protein
LTDLLEKAAALARARSWGHCEACGLAIHGRLDPHHRKARGAGGVHRDAAPIAHDVRNLLALCRPCHDQTEHGATWTETEALGWRVPSWRYAVNTPALLYTVNGHGWWYLTTDGGYQWAGQAPDWRIPSSFTGRDGPISPTW